MGKLFGTDGVRGVANLNLTAELSYQIGRAAGYVLSKNKGRKVIVGRDTRLSGDFIESSLVAGLLSIGLDVDIAGVIPTPGIAYLTRNGDYLCGVEISASHNPFEYNGIKFFSSDGYKLPDEVEEQIEDIILSKTKLFRDVTGEGIGKVNRDESFVNKYKNYLKNLTDADFSGYKVALDMGNGALSSIAEEVLKSYNAEVIAINNDPNGININDNCGSTNPLLIRKLTIESKADIGMSFDGDADRIIAVDEKGDIVDGDHILGICALSLKEDDRLKNNTVVGTIMSNIGLKKFLDTKNIKFVATKVGDRYILEEMLKNGYCIGAEKSGHVIFLDYNTTGDGIATGIHLLEIMKKKNKKLSELSSVMKDYPQVLKNVKVREDMKSKIFEFSEINEKIKELENKYKNNGRIVIRASGTEPLIRVMIEGENISVIEKDATYLAKIIEEKLN